MSWKCLYSALFRTSDGLDRHVDEYKVSILLQYYILADFPKTREKVLDAEKTKCRAYWALRLEDPESDANDRRYNNITAGSCPRGCQGWNVNKPRKYLKQHF